jgi:hypothetical protein
MSRIPDRLDRRFELAYRKARGEALTTEERGELEILDSWVDSNLPAPPPGLPEDVFAAMREAKVLTMKVYYFGCLYEPGHYLWENMHMRNSELFRQQPWGPRLDGYIHGSTVRDMTLYIPEGRAWLHHLNGWTLLSFWDHSVDTRPGSNSAFIAEGTFTFDEMVMAAKAHWPEVWKRFTFEVVEAPDA